MTRREAAAALLGAAACGSSAAGLAAASLFGWRVGAASVGLAMMAGSLLFAAWSVARGGGR